MPRVLVGSYPIRNKRGRFRDILTAAAFETVDPNLEGPLTSADYFQLLPGVDAIIAGGEALTAEVIAAFPALRVIARTGVGYDAIDLPKASEMKIAVTITPGTNHGSVAEQTFALLLALSRNVVGNDQTIKSGGWDRALVRPIRDCTLGLVGLGRIGKAVASRARAFEMNVIAYDPLPSGEFERVEQIRRVSFDQLLEESDIVSLHLPLTEATRNLIQRDTIKRMKTGALLINTARGGLVVEEDLRQAILSGKLAGAGLDVLNQEPPEQGNPLLSLPNVVLSPHIGGIDQKGMDDMATMAAWTIVELHQGRWPAGCVVNEVIREGWMW